MDQISDVTIGACENSKYIKPQRITYKQNGVEKTWDAMDVHSAVVVLLFNTSRNVFVFVKQFRPAVYINSVKPNVVDGVEVVDTTKYPGSLGVCVELCAGIVDKDQPLPNIVQAEILEECGYDVPLDNIRKITTCRGGIGTFGNNIHLYYAEITDEMHVKQVGGSEQEGIEVIEMPVEAGRQFIFDESVNRVHFLIGGVGISGNFIHLYYAEVKDEMRVGPGGGVEQEGEMIEVVEMSVDEGRKIMWDESVNRVYSLLVGLMWFFDQIWPKV